MQKYLKSVNWILVILLFLAILLGVYYWHLHKKNQISRLQEFTRYINTNQELLLRSSGLLPQGNRIFSSGLGAESYSQFRIMHTASGNKFFVPFAAREKHILINLKEHINELKEFLDDDIRIEDWSVKTISFFPVKVDLPLIISLDPSKWIQELKNINDGTHLTQKKAAENIPSNYAICYEIYPLPVEVKFVTPEKVKFYDRGLICSQELSQTHSEVLSFVVLWRANTLNKLIMRKNYYLPVELLPQVRNKDDFSRLLRQNKIIHISSTIMGVIF